MSLTVNSLRFALAIAVSLLFVCVGSNEVKAQTVGRAFHLDLEAIPDEYKVHFEEVRDTLNAMIQDYSNDLPPALLNELDQLYLVAAFVDLPPGLLGRAAPVIQVTFSSGAGPNLRTFTVPVAGRLEINQNTVDQMIIDNLLNAVITHEILHAFGFGSLWEENGMLSPSDDFGRVEQYTGGRYALKEFRRESNNPFAPFIPVQQFGGGGTRGAHWDDFNPFFNETFTPRFRKELMGGFACDVHPNDPDFIVCPNHYISRTTEAALADLGWAMFNINPNRTPRARSGSYKNWPELARVGNPFTPFSGLSLRTSNEMTNFVKHKNANTGTNQGGNVKDPNDPFKLKNQKWAK